MEWRIESRQSGVRRFEKPGHNYLALVNPEGHVIEELHGDPVGDRLRLWHRRDTPAEPLGYRGPGTGTDQRRSDELTAKRLDLGGRGTFEVWNEMFANAKSLDRKPARYAVTGPNSNSFVATLLRQSGFDPKQLVPDTGRIAPGGGTDLRNPALYYEYDAPPQEGDAGPIPESPFVEEWKKQNPRPPARNWAVRGTAARLLFEDRPFGRPVPDRGG